MSCFFLRSFQKSSANEQEVSFLRLSFELRTPKWIFLQCGIWLNSKSVFVSLSGYIMFTCLIGCVHILGRSRNLIYDLQIINYFNYKYLGNFFFPKAGTLTAVQLLLRKKVV